MSGARVRLACLWLSQLGRVMADQALRGYVLLAASGGAGDPDRPTLWRMAALMAVLAAVLAPLLGPLANGLPRRWILTGAATFCSAASLLLVVPGVPALLAAGLVAAGSALYGLTRYAMLPAAARDAAIPLSRVNGWIEAGAVIAVPAGLLLGGLIYVRSGQFLTDLLPVLTFFNLISILGALTTAFPSDARRLEGPANALAHFWTDAGRVLRSCPARTSLLGAAGIRALAAAAVVALYNARWPSAWLVLLPGVAAGALLASLQGHPKRTVGLVPYGLTLAALNLAWLAFAPHSDGVIFCLGLAAGLVAVPLNATYQAALPPDARGNGMALWNLACYPAMFGAGALFAGSLPPLGINPAWQLGLLAAVTGLAAVATWYRLFRTAFEQVLELILFPVYRIRAAGPGLGCFPADGPLLVYANHAAWVDPLLLAKVLPRQMTPMMTSMFFDLPVLHWFMRNVFRAIRVETSYYRRQAPELELAVAALDRGEAVLIFPEGWMRRVPEPRLRMFGQGVWHILAQRPETPVVACWIEGNFGSYCSYAGGPPTVNKRMDFWRRIDVAVSEPFVLDAKELTDHRTTRAHLMRACAEVREHLGLGPGIWPEAPEGDEEEKS